MKVYYAHPVSLYGTPQESRDLQLLKDLGFSVVNPNDDTHDIGYRNMGMEYFKEIVESCDLVAFRGFPDGSIPAGVAQEISWAHKVMELPSRIVGRTLTVEETREYLQQSGSR